MDQIRQKVTQIQMVPSFEKKTPIWHFFFDSESICERISVLSIYLSQRWEVCKGLHFTDKRKQTTSFCNLNYEDFLTPPKENFDSPATSSRNVMLVKNLWVIWESEKFTTLYRKNDSRYLGVSWWYFPHKDAPII